MSPMMNILLLPFLILNFAYSVPEKLLNLRSHSLGYRNLRPDQSEPYIFLSPNEAAPIDVLPLLRLSKPGVLLSVGTERGFMYASFSETISELLLVDDNKFVNLYNRINIALLKGCKNRLDYLRLRLKAGFSEWKKIANQEQFNDQERALLTSKQNWQWWVEAVRKNSRFSRFHQDAKSPIHRVRRFFLREVEDPPFEKANYLYIDKNFELLKLKAEKGKLRSELADLAGLDFIQVLENSLGQRSTKLSVVDISNAWGHSFMGDVGTIEFLDAIRPYVDNSTLLIITNIDTSGFFAVQDLQWSYHAFTFKEIYELGVQKFVSSIMAFGALSSRGVTLNGQRISLLEDSNSIKIQSCKVIFLHQ